MPPRPFAFDRDLPGVAELLSRTRAAGGLSHPGGIQWWLRDHDTNDDLAAFVWPVGDTLEGFALVDGAFVVIERSAAGPAALEQVGWLEAYLRDAGREEIALHVPDEDPLRPMLQERGYRRSGIELELVADVSAEPVVPLLPDGFAFASLGDVSDDAYVAGHVAAWSDTRPSSYSRRLHDTVKQAPTFRSDLVTIVVAPGGVVASCCIGWMDERSATLEIEPLGTHRDHRRLGLAHALVKEVQHRAWANGAAHVMVWNDPVGNPQAYGLYAGAGMRPARTLIQLSRPL